MPGVRAGFCRPSPRRGLISGVLLAGVLAATFLATPANAPHTCTFTATNNNGDRGPSTPRLEVDESDTVTIAENEPTTATISGGAAADEGDTGGVMVALTGGTSTELVVIRHTNADATGTLTLTFTDDAGGAADWGANTARPNGPATAL